MIELHRERVLEEIAPQRRVEEQARGIGHEAAVDQRPSVVDEAGAQARDQRAQIDLQQGENEQRQRGGAQPQWRRERGARRDILCGPERGGEDAAGQGEMERQPVLRHAHPIRQPGGDHPPADRAQRGAEAEDRPEPRAQPRLDRAPPEKPQQRQQERGADQPRQQPVRPLPPIDGLERIEAHARVALAILRDGLVLLELGLPAGGIERRHHPGHRLPLDDGKAGFGEPGGPAHHQGREDQRGHRQEPDADGAAGLWRACFERTGGSGHADRRLAEDGADHIVLGALSQIAGTRGPFTRH